MGSMENVTSYNIRKLSLKPGDILVMEVDVDLMPPSRQSQALARAAEQALEAKKAGAIPEGSFVWVLAKSNRLYRAKKWFFFPRWAIATYFKILFKTRTVNVED